MPLINFTETTLNNIKQIETRLDKIDNNNDFWKVMDKEIGKYKAIGIKGAVARQGVPEEATPSQSLLEKDADSFWLPTATGSISADLKTAVLADRGLCLVMVNIVHIDHRFVRPQGDVITSDVFGQFPLVTYKSKSDGASSTGVQWGLIHLGATVPVVVKAMADETEEFTIAVKYMQSDGTTVGTSDMIVNVL